MATLQGSGSHLSDPVSTVRRLFGITARIAVHPRHDYIAVTDEGRVFSWRISSRHRSGQVRELTKTDAGKGHLYVRLTGRNDAALVHRLVAECFLPPPGEGQNVVRHLDGNPANNTFGNLAWGTQAENMQDMIRHGRSLKGVKNPNAKLTNRRAKIVRALFEEGFRTDVIAHLFGVNQNSIERCVNCDSWSETGQL
jgi:hypothetical protein